MDSGIVVMVVVILLFVAVLGVVSTRIASRKMRTLWEPLAATIGGRATRSGVSGSYAGRAVETRATMSGGGPVSIYTFELTIAAGGAGQNRPWKLAAANGQWQVQSSDPSVSAGPLGAAIIAEGSRWQALHPDLPAFTRFDAAQGRLHYEHENWQRFDQALTRPVSITADVALYPIPSPAQFTAQLELLTALAAVNEQFNRP